MSASQPPPYADHLGANLRRLRERRGHTQESLAEAAEMDLTYYVSIERGKGNPSLRMLAALSVALGVTPARLLRKVPVVQRPPGRPKKRKR